MMATKVVPISTKPKKSFVLKVPPDSRLGQDLRHDTNEPKTIHQLVLEHFLEFLPKPFVSQPRHKVEEPLVITKDVSSSLQNNAVNDSNPKDEVLQNDCRAKSSDVDAVDKSCTKGRINTSIPQQRKLRSLLVTIENDDPLEDLSKYVDINITALTQDQKTKRLYTCPMCGKQFHESSYLISHQRTHTGEKPYDCNHCGKRFNHKTNLNKHERIHTGEKPYSCSQCGKNFRQNSHRSRHEGIHIREKIFKCPECGKTFPQNEEFVLHLQSHETERPYSCKNCGRRFGRLSNCTRHERTHSACKIQKQK